MSFRPTVSLFTQRSRSKASGSWLSRQSRDPYVKSRAQHPANFRSRSAFKLLEIQDAHGILTEPWVRTVVDLGAAPGGWSQAVANVFGFSNNEDVDDATAGIEDAPTVSPHTASPSSSSQTPAADARTIIALDLLPILPITGVHTLQADMLSPTTTTQLASLLQHSARPGYVDVLLSDMSGNHTGNRAADVEDALDLAKAVFTFSRTHLAAASSPRGGSGGVKHPGGTLVYAVVSLDRKLTKLKSSAG
jgi:23S rRNA (uridine2552-2'-O)-methyltransferase